MELAAPQIEFRLHTLPSPRARKSPSMTQTNMLRPSIVKAGLDPDNLPERGAIDIANDISVETREARRQRWKDIWSAGHSVSDDVGRQGARSCHNRERSRLRANRNASVLAPANRQSFRLSGITVGREQVPCYGGACFPFVPLEDKP